MQVTKFKRIEAIPVAILLLSIVFVFIGMRTDSIFVASSMVNSGHVTNVTSKKDVYGTLRTAENAALNTLSSMSSLGTLNVDVSRLAFNAVYSETDNLINKRVFEIIAAYCKLSCNGIDITPLAMIAQANTETGYRSEIALTHSFTTFVPSCIYSDLKTVEDVDSINCLQVILSEENFESLASDFSTRDRGPLQIMSETSGNIDGLSTVSEYQLLEAYYRNKSIPTWTTTTRVQAGNGKYIKTDNFSVQEWINKARTLNGDRFNIKDCALMYQSRMTGSMSDIEKYTADHNLTINEWTVIALMGYAHWRPTFLNEKYTRNDGTTGIVQRYEYCMAMSSPEILDYISDWVTEDIASKRAGGHEPYKYSWDGQVEQWYGDWLAKGWVKEMDYYFDKTYSNWEIAMGYPARMIAGVMYLEKLYSGE